MQPYEFKAVAALAAAALAACPAPARAGPEPEAARPPSVDVRFAAARHALRAMDCARCHGRDYEGLAAPSVVEYARTQSREMFLRALLDGDPGRGMPGYRGVPLILDNIEDIYRYFLERTYRNALPGSDTVP
jgi:mono/diheme cytochrome c family protein